MSLHKRIAAHRARAYLRMVEHALRYRRRLHDEMVSNTKWVWKQATKTVDLRQRAERAEAAHAELLLLTNRLLAMETQVKDIIAERDALRDRAERAEALLREASKEGYLYHAGYCQYVDLKPRPCNCGFEAWQKRVLEGKT